MSTRFLVHNNPGKFQGTSSSKSANDVKRTEKTVAPYTIVSRPVHATGWVNLRRTPSTDTKVLNRCYAGKTLTVLAELNNWLKVQDPATGVIGYISSKYVSRA